MDKQDGQDSGLNMGRSPRAVSFTAPTAGSYTFDASMDELWYADTYVAKNASDLGHMGTILVTGGGSGLTYQDTIVLGQDDVIQLHCRRERSRCL
jgi:hypothetical protein